MWKKMLAVIIIVALGVSCGSPSYAENKIAETSTASELTKSQLNSVVMLNYLTTLTQEINSSEHSKLYLEEALSSLYNNTVPSAVDETTQQYLNNLIDTLENYRLIEKKRERLEYIYEQNKAQALRSAVPSPLGLLAAVQSFSLKKMVASVVYMAVDAATSYQKASTEADMQYLQDGWELEDERERTLANSRQKLFNYMLTLSREQNIPDDFSLTEKMVEEYVTWKNEENVSRQIRYLEDNQDTYKGFGDYWLTLVKSYYKAAENNITDDGYTKCLEALSQYEELDINIFRKDRDYAGVLPLGISAASETLPKNTYVKLAERYCKDILDNTENEDWSLRYFAAQTYIDLYAKTKRDSYLENAYKIALNNVNSLATFQREKNVEYLSDLKLLDIPDGITKQEKNDIKQYNKLIKKSRMTELPPVYEPLVLNLDLLFALAGQMDLPEKNKKEIDRILHDDGELFLIKQIDDQYRFETTSEEEKDISFDGEKLMVPVKYISEASKIQVTIYDGDGTLYEDWKLEEVERNKSNKIENFYATYSSQAIKKYKYTVDSTIQVEIITQENSGYRNITVNFHVDEYKDLKIWKKITFSKI